MRILPLLRIILPNLFTHCVIYILLVPSVSGQETSVTALTGGRIIDGTPDPPIEDGVVIVEGNTIVTVGKRSTVEVPASAQVIDVSGSTILPGLADSHTHLTFFRAHPAEFEDDSLVALRASAILRDALDAGITLVRGVGGRNYVPIGLKHALAKGYIEGSRFVTCNQIVGITGSHGSKFELMLPPKILLQSDSPLEWRRHIRQNLKMGADFVMVAPPYTFEEIELAVKEAHGFGVLIGAEGAGYVIGPAAQTGSYAYPGTRTVEYAVRAQVDIVEHLHPMENEDAVREMMRRQGTIVVPTVSASERLAGERWTHPTEQDRRWHTTAQEVEDRFRKMYASKVKMAVGTDAIGSHQGQIAAFYTRELELFMKWGYSAHEVIQAATRIGAEASGLGAQLGTLEPGKWADLIVIPGNPFEDITLLTQPTLVMKNGVIVRRK